MTKGWVWYSTRESIEGRKISVLACVETVLAVTASLWLAGSTGFYWQIILSLIIAPLVLFQSAQSIAAAYRWFSAYMSDDPDRSPRAVSISVALAALVAFAVAYFAATSWLQNASWWAAFGIGVAISLIALGSAIAVVVTVTGIGLIDVTETRTAAFVVSGLGTAMAAGTVVGTIVSADIRSTTGSGSAAIFGVALPTVVIPWLYFALARKPQRGPVLDATHTAVEAVMINPATVLAIFLRSLVTRFASTLLFIRSGAKAFPRNWSRLVLMTDTARSPELVIAPPGEDDGFALSAFTEDFNGPALEDRFLLGLIALICLPSLLYRWSVKSTFWIYGPILYLAYLPEQHRTAEGLAIWLRSTPQTLIEKWRLLVAILSILSLAGTLINWTQAIDLYAFMQREGLAFSALNIVFVLDFGRFTWAHAVSLTVAAITLLLAVQLDRLRIEEKEGRELDMRAWEIQAIYFTFRLRGALGIIWIALALYYFLDTLCHLQTSCPAGVGPFIRDFIPKPE
ncbi:MAG: hypothetical protein AAGF94_01015 [Pseudomonadota bacterium]